MGYTSPLLNTDSLPVEVVAAFYDHLAHIQEYGWSEGYVEASRLYLINLSQRFGF